MSNASVSPSPRPLVSLTPTLVRRTTPAVVIGGAHVLVGVPRALGVFPLIAALLTASPFAGPVPLFFTILAAVLGVARVVGGVMLASGRLRGAHLALAADVVALFLAVMSLELRAMLEPLLLTIAVALLVAELETSAPSRA